MVVYTQLDPQRKEGRVRFRPTREGVANEGKLRCTAREWKKYSSRQSGWLKILPMDSLIFENSPPAHTSAQSVGPGNAAPAQSLEFQSSPVAHTSPESGLHNSFGSFSGESTPESSAHTPAMSSVQRQWQEKHAEELAKKREESLKEIDMMKEDADAFLKEEKANRDRICEVRKKSNKDAEAKEAATRDALLESGTDWERVAALSDLSKKSNPATARMREILISLK